MKKSALFLLAGGLLTFAACTNDEAPAGSYTQEQVDSAVNARVAELQASMQASNDSAINSLAQWKADSMIAAAKGAPAPARPTGRTNTTKPTTPATPTTTTPVKQKGDVTDRKSTQDAKQNADVTDRKSTQEKKENVNVTDRKSKQN